MESIIIIIPTHNRVDSLKKLLRQLTEQKKTSYIYKIVVVVDGSTDGTLQLLEQGYPDVDIIKGDGSLWYTQSINKGINYALEYNADYILTLNDDVVLDEKYLDNIMASVSSFSEPVIVGSVSYTATDPVKIMTSGVKEIKWWRNKFVQYFPFLSEVEPEKLTGLKKTFVLPGRGMLIDTRIVKKIGGFDARFAQYHSDTDFCLRAINSGFSVFISWDARLYAHVLATSSSSSFVKSSFSSLLKSLNNRYSRNYLPDLFRFNMRHGPKWLIPIRIPISLLAIFKAYFLNVKA